MTGRARPLTIAAQDIGNMQIGKKNGRKFVEEMVTRKIRRKQRMDF